MCTGQHRPGGRGRGRGVILSSAAKVPSTSTEHSARQHFRLSICWYFLWVWQILQAAAWFALFGATGSISRIFQACKPGQCNMQSLETCITQPVLFKQQQNGVRLQVRMALPGHCNATVWESATCRRCLQHNLHFSRAANIKSCTNLQLVQPAKAHPASSTRCNF